MSTRKPPKGQKSNFFSGNRKSGQGRSKSTQSDAEFSSKETWLYGDHAVMAALQNPKRKIRRLALTKSKAEHLTDGDRAVIEDFDCLEILQPDQLHALLPENAIHQGIAVQANPLHAYDVEDIPELTEGQTASAVAVLDQVTDPHNVGAVLRSAAAFGVAAIIIPDRHSPPITGVLARSASGAVETVPLIRVNNLARALDKLAELGYWRIGMDGTASQELDDAVKGADKVALILGSEGKGLRRLTAEKCDLMCKLPISPKIESLNVSNAAAIAFYEMARRLRKQ